MPENLRLSESGQAVFRVPFVLVFAFPGYRLEFLTGHGASSVACAAGCCRGQAFIRDGSWAHLPWENGVLVASIWMRTDIQGRLSMLSNLIGKYQSRGKTACCILVISIFSGIYIIEVSDCIIGSSVRFITGRQFIRRINCRGVSNRDCVASSRLLSGVIRQTPKLDKRWQFIRRINYQGF